MIMLDLDIHFLFKNYNLFKEKSFNSSKIFKYSELLKMIKTYENICSIVPVGTSIENRKIFKIQWGSGTCKVFIWSQMHGNETTGTKAMFDILHFFLKEKNHDLVKFIRKNLTILFIPMLNPDGSEKYQRRNAVNIDLNRDAIRLQSPEIQILFHEIQYSNPNILFNLHDQRSIYNVGNKNFNPAILSFLCPSVKEEKNTKISPERKKAMGLIAFIEKKIRSILPNIGSIGRFSDEFYPTATGDNLQKKGYPCILFEAGNYPKDPKKDIIRKYNALSILIGFYFLSFQKIDFEKEYSSYFTIPENKKKLLDKIYRGVEIQRGKYQFLVDIGIRNIEKFNFVKNDIDLISKIVDIGDLSNFFAYEDFRGKKFHLKGINDPIIGDIELFDIL
ncbi:M14 family peptidase [Blattabacterium sp. (Periplaneta americana) str. BPLAN]|uniref:M14 family zinc carboxypeptidase n=1 Tax=Blattabacterium sp. (Periplaneta americana) TaxID=367488 RepID=UPI0001BA0D2C|nr:M14 family peptidase [Blattabacterium sp. (Periplaneta americana) str. BPLAN]